MFSGSFMSLTYLPDDRARPVADAVFAEVAKLPPIRALDEELKTAYQKQQKNSQGFIPKKSGEGQLPVASGPVYITNRSSYP